MSLKNQKTGIMSTELEVLALAESLQEPSASQLSEMEADLESTNRDLITFCLTCLQQNFLKAAEVKTSTGTAWQLSFDCGWQHRLPFESRACSPRCLLSMAGRNSKRKNIFYLLNEPCSHQDPLSLLTMLPSKAFLSEFYSNIPLTPKPP